MGTPTPTSRHVVARTIRSTRIDLADLLANNPSLKPVLLEAMETAYARARDDAASENRLSVKRFPEHYPRTFEQVTDAGFWPGITDT